MLQKVGVMAFIIGLIISLIAGFISTAGLGIWTIVILGLLGVIVGLINIADKEVRLFLLASITFMISASSLATILSVFPGGSYFQTIMQTIVVFVAPGAAVVSLRALYDVARAV